MKTKKQGNNWTAYYDPETKRYFAEIMYTSREGREQYDYEITKDIYSRLGTFGDDVENERLIKTAKMTYSFENTMYGTLGPERTAWDEEAVEAMRRYEQKSKKEMKSRPARDQEDAVSILKVDNGTPLADRLLTYVENCSWTEAKAHIAETIRNRDFTDWETMFAAFSDGKIVGMASVRKTDYYPLPEICPWVSCLFVSEEYRGRKISGKLIAYANRYLKEKGFDRSYIPAAFFGLYEQYGYTYLRDIVNYGGETDHLFVKEF